MEAMTKKVILARLKENNVAFLTDTSLSKIEDSGIMVTNLNHGKQFIAAEKVVIAIGTRSNTKLFDQINGLGFEIHQIGDCLEPRNAKDAIYESEVLGRAI